MLGIAALRGDYGSVVFITQLGLTISVGNNKKIAINRYFLYILTWLCTLNARQASLTVLQHPFFKPQA